MKGPLVIFKKEWCKNKKKTVNSEVYIKHILPYLVTFREAHTASTGRELVYMEDNASIHTLKATQAAERAMGITSMWWPANSPDLNPIKNVWRLLKYRVEKRFPHTKEDIKQYLQEEWEKIQVTDYQKYTTSMRERCQAVMDAGGGHTKW
jgi:transposase